MLSLTTLVSYLSLAEFFILDYINSCLNIFPVAEKIVSAFHTPTRDLPWTCHWELHSCLLGLENSHVLILYPKAMAAAKEESQPHCCVLIFLLLPLGRITSRPTYPLKISASIPLRVTAHYP